MTGRPWLKCVWERSFATEDEADDVYEQMMEWLDTKPLEVDRLDGHTVRLYLDTAALESKAQLIESAYEVPTLTTFCECGHIAASHDGDELTCKVRSCKCAGFVRQPTPQGDNADGE